jgi:hypothetical protein
MWTRLSERFELGFIERPLAVYRPNADRRHLQDDGRLRVREARRFLASLERRRTGASRTDEELEGLARFRAQLAQFEASLPAGPE